LLKSETPWVTFSNLQEIHASQRKMQYLVSITNLNDISYFFGYSLLVTYTKLCTRLWLKNETPWVTFFNFQVIHALRKMPYLVDFLVIEQLTQCTSADAGNFSDKLAWKN